MDIQTKRYDGAKLRAFCANVFAKAGVPRERAEQVADSLVYADLRGVDSHGVVRTDVYLSRLEAGLIEPEKDVKVVAEDGAVSLIDGGNNFGAVVGRKALAHALDAAAQHGVSMTGVRHSNHFGTCAYYVQKAIERGFLLMVFSNAAPTMPPTGGIRPFFGTNPIAAGFPAGEERPFLMDMATSVVARGKIIVAAKKKEKIPTGWALDRDGKPTTDPAKALQGALLPFGGPKGYALAMFMDILCGVMTGSGFGPSVLDMYGGKEGPQNVGHLFLAMDIARIMPLDAFKARMDAMIRMIKAEPKAEHAEEILIPGELEFRREEERRREGIPLPEAVVRRLAEIGSKHGLSLEEARIR